MISSSLPKVASLGKTRGIICTAFLIAVLGMPPALGKDAQNPIRIDGVIGTDDRQLIDSLAPPWNAVGKININGYRKRQHCTATLIAPDKVITAAHCLKDRQTGSPFQTGRIHFLAGVQRGDFLDHATAACVHFVNQNSTSSPLREDIAIVVLAKELSIPPAPVFTQQEVYESTSLIHAGYTRDRPHSLAADSTCHLKSSREGLWFTDCDTNFGASGGPVFINDANTLKLAAVMIGYSKDRHSIAVSRSAWNFTNQEQTCN